MPLGPWTLFRCRFSVTQRWAEGAVNSRLNFLFHFATDRLNWPLMMWKEARDSTGYRNGALNWLNDFFSFSFFRPHSPGVLNAGEPHHLQVLKLKDLLLLFFFFFLCPWRWCREESKVLCAVAAAVAGPSVGRKNHSPTHLVPRRRLLNFPGRGSFFSFFFFLVDGSSAFDHRDSQSH